MVGVAPNAQILPVRILGLNGSYSRLQVSEVQKYPTLTLTPLASPVGDAARTSRQSRPTQWLPLRKGRELDFRSPPFLIPIHNSQFAIRN
jgi:hypothetical protein